MKMSKLHAARRPRLDLSAINRPGTMPLRRVLEKARVGDRFATACAKAMFDPRLVVGDIGDFDTGTLMEVLYAPPQVPGIVGFWLNYFPQTVNSDNQEIRFDAVDLNEYRLAPFVVPNVQGRVQRGVGYQVKTFRPAYVKAKHVVDPQRAIPRRAGERPFGSLSLQERYEAIVADNMRRERLTIENRWDWMACQAIVNAAVTISGEDYPTTVVDFNRDASLSATLAGPATWDLTTALPMQDIQLMRTKSFKLSHSPVTQLVFGLDAWNAFIDDSHAEVQILLNAFFRGTTSNFNQAGVSDGSPYEYQGSIAGFAGAGRLDLWTYNNEYEDDEGNFYPYMDQGTVVGIGQNMKGIRCFGAIMDKRAGLAAVDMFPKMWDEDDPSVTYTMTQSAPLMVPLRPNNSFALKVVADTENFGLA
jgi:hypothetical protein